MRLAYAIAWTWAALIITAVAVNSGINCWYASQMLFITFAPEGHSGPLHEVAVTFAEQHPERFFARRLYAVEFWLTSWPAAIGAAIAPLVSARAGVAWMEWLSIQEDERGE